MIGVLNVVVSLLFVLLEIKIFFFEDGFWNNCLVFCLIVVLSCIEGFFWFRKSFVLIESILLMNFFYKIEN